MKLSIDEIKKRFEKLDCKLVSTEYRNIYTKLDFVCNKHLDKGIQQTSLRNVNRGLCCHFCGNENSRNSRKVPEEELKRMTENNGFIYVGNELTNGKRYIIYKCPKHLNIGEQKTLVGTMRISKGNCPECINRNKDTNKFVNELKSINNNIKILGEYVNSHKKIKCKCKICGYEWYGQPNNLLSGEGCRKCSDIKNGLRCRNTEQWFIDKMKILHPNIQVLSKFTTMKAYVQCKCDIDGYSWSTTPDALINKKTGCPKCVRCTGENQLDIILEKWGYEYEIQKKFEDCKDKCCLPFDRYLPNFNIAIEYDGEQHYFPVRFGSSFDEAVKNFKRTCLHDEIKNQYCKDNNIALIRIPYWEKDNMEIFLFDQLVKYGAIQLVS